MMKRTLWQRLVQAFWNAPADKMILALLLGSGLLGGVIGALLGFSFVVSAYAGMLGSATLFWAFVRKARIHRERAAAHTTASILSAIFGRGVR